MQLVKISVTLALIELDSSFWAHFKANEMLVPMTHHTEVECSTASGSPKLSSDLELLKMWSFNIFYKNIFHSSFNI
jgi:hypothetical protein